MGSNWMRSTCSTQLEQSRPGAGPGGPIRRQILEKVWVSVCVCAASAAFEWACVFVAEHVTYTPESNTNTHTYIHTQILDDDSDDERDYAAASSRRAPTLFYPRALTRRVEIVQTMHLQQNKTTKMNV